MASSANQNPLWRSAFGQRDNDEHASARARLAGALERMGDSVEQLLKMIPADCKGLTLHDISHLDAVWEMAALIAGEDYPLNPAEVYVLGAAILLHDAGLASASYSGGEDQIKSTEEWSDISAVELKRNGLTASCDQIANPPAHLKPSILFATLRELHAKQATRMATEPWSINGIGEIFLIDDVELRQAFGESIGRVAHSHHWSIEKVATELRDNLGVSTILPSEWAVSERKIACILRCADAAHIDRRRAPTILFAATKPVNLSHKHWSSQNKINKPTVDGGSLIYTAGSSYDINEADAWWLTYDLIRLADKEIRSSNALLEELGYPNLRVARVFGAESPRALSSRVRTTAWQPIDAEVRVSDPVHLALTLGGKNLYGRDVIAPIRELMQNAADAIRARRALEEREATWGSIIVTVDPDPDDEDACIIHIDDDGIGMSERVLAGPLIDFGKSIWNSDLLRSEFPGLQSKNVKPIGKFGIGFFSVFELADNVSVISKHYEKGIDDARVLEFTSITARPHIRSARAKELPRDKSTRVSLKVKDKRRVSGSARLIDVRFAPRHKTLSFSDQVLFLVAFLDVKVLYHNRIDGTSFEHSAAIYEVGAADFLDEVLVGVNADLKDRIKESHASRLSVVTDAAGVPYGRAALAMLRDDDWRSRSATDGAVSVGGFSYQHGSGLPVAYIGAVEGLTEEASRREAFSQASSASVAAWATRQGELINQNEFFKVDLIKACKAIVKAGGDPKDLPYSFNQGRLIDAKTTRAVIESIDEVFVLLKADSGENFSFVNYESLPSNLYEAGVDKRAFVICDKRATAFETQAGREIFKGIRRTVVEVDISKSDPSFSLFLRMLNDAWGVQPSMRVETTGIFGGNYRHIPDPYWSLRIKR